jgi:hypothetical protein
MDKIKLGQGFNVLTNRAFVHNVLGMRSFMDDDTEIDKNKSHKLCSMRETDETGIPNLCFCYIIDADGKYQDSCYHPVHECCRAGFKDQYSANT